MGSASEGDRRAQDIDDRELVDRPVDVAIVVGPGSVHPGPDSPAEKAKLFGLPVDRVVDYRLHHLRGRLDEAAIELLAERLLTDRVSQWWMRRDEHEAPSGHGPVAVVETGLRPGVTDREAAELRRAAGVLGIELEAAASAHRWFVFGDLDDDQVGQLAERVLHNPVIERWASDELAPAHTDPAALAPPTAVITLADLDHDQLVEVSRGRRLGLTGVEMEAIQKHFAAVGREPTDGELETLAQTWSEHCSHKTFRATIVTPDGPIAGLLDTFIRGATEAIDAPWVESAFVDNAGIIRFDDRFDLALKAETHNHPSALEPFGGANTGVGGVVRDILGVSARPIAVTDVLCFGPEDLPVDELPDGVLHPRRVRAGVVAGIGDYGNKIGVPNLAGAIFHDPTYTTTPLVFAGCVGLLPHGSNPTDPAAGDAVVVLGGAVGRDGVGGATFSSQSMGLDTAEVAGSSVQIGDPVVEKGLIDVVLAARDAGLYTAITDCGAGGLSSAVGEMASDLGAEVDLALVPRKYPGLAPWEVWLSEAQERMVLAVPDPAPLRDLAERWGVDATVIGRFTGDGRLVVTDDGHPVVDLDVGFLHRGRPPLELEAVAPSSRRSPRSPAERVGTDIDPNDALVRLLAHPSLRSNEDVVRTYDHEVLGGTLIRPYDGAALDGPADGTALIPPGTVDPSQSGPRRAAAIGIGAAPLIGRFDCEAMAWAAVDEAIRNAVVAGADPHRLSLLDNFAWGDPTDPEMLGRLVAACRGCHDAAVSNGAPFVSGKDSLYNEFVHADGRRDPVTPTLVVTAVGVVDDIDLMPAVGVCEAGDDVWLIGPATGVLGGSHLDEVTGGDQGGHVPGPDPEAVDRHRVVANAIRAGIVVSAHDLAEGGLAVAAAEWAFAGRRGLTLAVAEQHRAYELFGEGLGRYLLEIRPTDAGRPAGDRPDGPADRLGHRRRPPPYRDRDRPQHRRHRPGLRRPPPRRPVARRSHRGHRPGDRGGGATMTAGSQPSVIIPVAPGTNRDGEMAAAFEAAGARAATVPLEALRRGEVKLVDHQILGLPGGFSYGDALGAGQLLGLDLTAWFADELAEARERGMPMIGVCNGFQALIRSGLLPGSVDGAEPGFDASLVGNVSGRFECRWVDLSVGAAPSPWLDGLEGPLRCPVAHGEGRFVSSDAAAVASSGLVAFRYADPDGQPADGTYPANPNGSEGDVAGIVDPTGLILGLMPHPEDHVFAHQDPRRRRPAPDGPTGSCAALFAAGVRAVAEA